VSRPLPCDDGGGGLANGFGGPVAPADSKADADGDGGGNTGPFRPSRIGVSTLESRCGRCIEGELVFGLLFSDSSSSAGICTLSRGLLASDAMLLVLLGAMGGIVDMAGVDDVRCGWGGLLVGAGAWVGLTPFIPFNAFPRFMALTSSDCDLASAGLSSVLGGSGAESQCLASNDRLSSMGVKMLCTLEFGKGLGCGSGGLLN